MNAYLFQASLYCNSCGSSIRAALRAQGKAPRDENDEHTYDSDDFPKGPFPDGGGEADTPQHCDDCGKFLENPLTSDGIEYVRERLAECEIIAPDSHLSEWASFYKWELEDLKSKSSAV